MPDLLLYTLIVPSAAQAGLGHRERQEVAKAGVLGDDVGSAEPIAGEPGDQDLEGVYRGRYAEKMAHELEELASASGFDTVPLAGVGESTPKDGYYSIEDARVRPVQPQTGRAQRYELSLTERGQKGSHYRVIETNPRQADHEFGNGLEERIGIPATASKVQWYDPETDNREPATAIETRTVELGDVDIYDLEDGRNALGVEDADLAYTIDYVDEELTDSRIYDTLGNDSKHDERGSLQWQKVFSTDHDADGEIVVDNGLLRIHLDEVTGTLEVEEWDPDKVVPLEDTGLYDDGLYGDGLYGDDLYAGRQGAWADTDLEQPEDVTLFDVDVSAISMVNDRAQLTFDAGDLFTIDVSLQRGRDELLVEIPEGETGPIPDALEEWLAPVASESIVDVQPAKGLLSRSRMRR